MDICTKLFEKKLPLTEEQEMGKNQLPVDNSDKKDFFQRNTLKKITATSSHSALKTPFCCVHTAATCLQPIALLY